MCIYIYIYIYTYIYTHLFFGTRQILRPVVHPGFLLNNFKITWFTKGRRNGQWHDYLKVGHIVVASLAGWFEIRKLSLVGPCRNLVAISAVVDQPRNLSNPKKGYLFI